MQHNPSSNLCWSCGGAHLRHVVTFENAACVTQSTYPTAQQAKNAPTGTMTLFQCQDCGCMQNLTFDEARVNYENYSLSLINSPAYQQHVQTLISLLREKYHIAHAKIVEIGCGDAHLLYTIAKATDSKGIGYDPSFEKRREKLAQNQADDFNDFVTIFSEYFSESAIHKDTDVLLCRHVLEHIPEPINMLRSIHDILAGGGGESSCCF